MTHTFLRCFAPNVRQKAGRASSSAQMQQARVNHRETSSRNTIFLVLELELIIKTEQNYFLLRKFVLVACTSALSLQNMHPSPNQMTAVSMLTNFTKNNNIQLTPLAVFTDV